MEDSLIFWIAGALVLALVLFAIRLFRSYRALTIRAPKKTATRTVKLKHSLHVTGEIIAQQRFRMGVMFVSTAILLAAVFFIAKQQIGVLLFKANLMTMAAIIGYWIDRTAFPYSRPGKFKNLARSAHAEYRRALIIAASLLTAGLGA